MGQARLGHASIRVTPCSVFGAPHGPGNPTTPRCRSAPGSRSGIANLSTSAAPRHVACAPASRADGPRLRCPLRRRSPPSLVIPPDRVKASCDPSRRSGRLPSLVRRRPGDVHPPRHPGPSPVRSLPALRELTESSPRVPTSQGPCGGRLGHFCIPEPRLTALTCRSIPVRRAHDEQSVTGDGRIRGNLHSDRFRRIMSLWPLDVLCCLIPARRAPDDFPDVPTSGDWHSR